jgi:sensor histidine kinase regulating citrate/malate metabolism
MAEKDRRKLRDSLKFKLGLLITSLVVSTVLLVGAILLRQQRNSLTAEMTKRGLAIASNLAATANFLTLKGTELSIAARTTAVDYEARLEFVSQQT